MGKSKTNLIIDAIMFLGMMFLTGTGFVRKYILLGGSASRAVYGGKIDMYMFGFNRDDWSQIHLYTAYFLLGLLAIHIYLHWKQLTIMYKQLVGNSQGRVLLTIIFLICSVLLVVFPFIIPPSF